ncbi:MAG: class A beta-lactamase-related serine hydrolase [Flavobacteriales bacterium]|nr:MAG: class A beta-lactamase-related serine hydrolase [Flavobacteriales bacterium]
MKRSTALPCLLAPFALLAQETYYPPTTGSTWATTDPATLGWCTDQLPPLLDFLEASNTKAFIVLKDGRIVIEEYFGTFTQDSSWYWASAGKSLTAFLVGLAQQDGLLDIDEPSSTYLGNGWTSCTPEQESAITVRHQLTMTTGLDDGAVDPDCTDPGCLQYLAEPGTRWAYHNAPYTKLDGVITDATGQNLNGYVYNKLGQSIGLLGLYAPIGSNNVFFSTPRAMARFGLLAMSGGHWNGTPIMSDSGYFTAMTTPSQGINPAYGYLWWLNGQDSYMLPGIPFSFTGPLMPDAPPDAYNAMGKNGQVVNVVPAQGLVVVRMGDLPGGIFVPNAYNNDIWERLNAVMCTGTGLSPGLAANLSGMLTVDHGRMAVTAPPGARILRISTVDGKVVHGTTAVGATVPTPSGVLIVTWESPDGTVHPERIVMP